MSCLPFSVSDHVLLGSSKTTYTVAYMGEITSTVSPRVGSSAVPRALDHFPTLAGASVPVERFVYPKSAAIWAWRIIFVVGIGGHLTVIVVGEVRAQDAMDVQGSPTVVISYRRRGYSRSQEKPPYD